MSANRASRSRNPRGQGSRLREEIIASATRLVDDGGSPVTLRAVAREAGIAAPSIYDHFSDVSQIRAAVRAGCFEDLDRALLRARDPLGDPVDRLQAVCRAYLAYAQAHPARYALMFAADRPAQPLGGSAPGAFATLLASLGECVRALRSTSKDTYADAVALWSGLHGIAGLRAGVPGFQWPAEADLEARLLRQLARVTLD